MPWDFWRLTVREFKIKHAAFSRAEDRRRSLVIELAARVSPSTKQHEQNKRMQLANTLRRYPVKRWLMSD